MSYTEQGALYGDPAVRLRATVCIRQQALIFAADGRPDIKALAAAIVAGGADDVEALIWAVVVGPNWQTLDADGDLLAAVQGAWPTVAAARHPDATAS